MRKSIETAFEVRTGGTALIPWLFQQHNEGASLRTIADRLSETVGIRVSHETVRRWMLDG